MQQPALDHAQTVDSGDKASSFVCSNKGEEEGEQARLPCSGTKPEAGSRKSESLRGTRPHMQGSRAWASKGRPCLQTECSSTTHAHRRGQKTHGSKH